MNEKKTEETCLTRKPALREAAEALRAFRRAHLDAWRFESIDAWEHGTHVHFWFLPHLQESSFGEVLGTSLGSPGVSWAVLAPLG